MSASVKCPLCHGEGVLCTLCNLACDTCECDFDQDPMPEEKPCHRCKGVGKLIDGKPAPKVAAPRKSLTKAQRVEEVAEPADRVEMAWQKAIAATNVVAPAPKVLVDEAIARQARQSGAKFPSLNTVLRAAVEATPRPKRAASIRSGVAHHLPKRVIAPIERNALTDAAAAKSAVCRVELAGITAHFRMKHVRAALKDIPNASIRGEVINKVGYGNEATMDLHISGRVHEFRTAKTRLYAMPLKEALDTLKAEAQAASETHEIVQGKTMLFRPRRTQDHALLEPRAATPFKMVGMEWIELCVHQHADQNSDATTYRHKGWIVSEVSTGAQVGYGGNRKEAIDYAYINMFKAGEDRVRTRVAEYLVKIAPELAKEKETI